MRAESEMTDEDWEDIMESEFVNIAEGVSSYALIFEHNELGLHGFQLKKSSKGVTLEPKSFSKKSKKSTKPTESENQ